MIETVQGDLRAARLARDTKTVGALTMVLTALQNAAKDAGGTLSEPEAVTVLQRERKRRQEAATSFREGGREEQASSEEFEAGLIERYLPARLADEDLAALVHDAIAEAGASSPRDLGAVMKLVQPRVAGRADGKAVSSAVRAALGG
jgi:uncharacterized protein YqeY